jgi:sensor histidine kinase YesM
VENAILHGLKNKEGNDGILAVDIIQIDNKIQYTITDNGIGRKAAEKISHNKESHYGLQITGERIRLFNREEVATVHITDLYNNNRPDGTSVTIILNVS